MLIAASGRECDALKVRYREKVQDNVRRDKRNSTIALVRKAEAAVYRIKKELAGHPQTSDGPLMRQAAITVEAVKRALNHDSEPYDIR